MHSRSPSPAAAAITLAVALSASSPAFGARLMATPETFDQTVSRARGGDTIILGPGNYPALGISRRNFSPALTIDGSNAVYNGVLLVNTKGVRFVGGEFRLPAPRRNPRTGAVSFGAAIRANNVERVEIAEAKFAGPARAGVGGKDRFGEGYGVFAQRTDQITVRDSQFDGFKTGVVVTLSQNFRVAGNHFTGMRSDGVQVSKSQNGLIERNRCDGTRIRSEEHPDCIQMWSQPDAPPTSDVTIRHNTMEGPTQGIGLFNHTRKGVNDGGFDRIIIEENVVNVSRPNAITILEGRDSIVRNNRVTTDEGARWQARIRTVGSVIRCGNRVAAGAGGPAVNDPDC